MLIPGCVEATIQGLAVAQFGCGRLVRPDFSRALQGAEPAPPVPRALLPRVGASASAICVSGWLPTNLAADSSWSNGIQPAAANDLLPDLVTASAAMPAATAVSLTAIILAMSTGPIEERERF